MIILDVSIDTVADNLTARSRPLLLLGTGGGVPLLVAGQGAAGVLGEEGAVDGRGPGVAAQQQAQLVHDPITVSEKLHVEGEMRQRLPGHSIINKVEQARSRPLTVFTY